MQLDFMTKENSGKNQKLRCFKCFITLERLMQDGLADYLIKLVDEKGDEKCICPNCLAGW